MKSIEEQWDEIMKVLPDQFTPAGIEAMFRVFTKERQDRTNRIAAEQYPKAVRTWLMQYRGNGIVTPVPIPSFMVKYVPRLTSIGWVYDTVYGTDFVTEPWRPDDKFLSRLSSEELAVIGYSAPSLPPSGVARVGPRLPNGWYAVLAGDTVLNGEEVIHNGLTLRKVIREGMGRGYRWYEVTS